MKRTPLSKRVTKIIIRMIKFRRKKKPLVKRTVMPQSDFDEASIYI